jgi:hypothetical protein
MQNNGNPVIKTLLIYVFAFIVMSGLCVSCALSGKQTSSVSTQGAVGDIQAGNISVENVKIEYLKINNRLINERDRKIALYRQLLQGGKVYVTGKAAAGNNKIVSVEVSNDKKTWSQITLSEKGRFEYTFRPESEKVYELYIKATDSTGLHNDIDKIRKDITVSDKNIQSLVREAIDDIVSAYESRNISRVMSYFSEDFYHDATILERAIRAGDSLYYNPYIRYSINSVVPDYTDKIFASVTFTRSYTVIKTNKIVNDSGTTTFIFRFENDGLKVISMTKPLIFLVNYR